MTGDEGYVDSYVEVVEGRVVADEDFVVGDEKPSPAPTGSVAEPVATGNPALTLSGTLVGSSSTNVAGDEVVFRLAGSLDAAEGTVMILRAASCDPGVTLVR